MKMRVAVGSTNPVKVHAVKNAVTRVFDKAEILDLEVESAVRHQPLSFNEAINGALNRAKEALSKTGYDIGIGLEGGVENTDYGYFTCGWVAAVDGKGRVGIGSGAAILLPSTVSSRIKDGKELGEIMDELTGQTDTKRKMGALGILTKNLVTRGEEFESGVICALAPFISPSLYPQAHRER